MDVGGAPRASRPTWAGGRSTVDVGGAPYRERGVPSTRRRKGETGGRAMRAPTDDSKSHITVIVGGAPRVTRPKEVDVALR